MLHVLSVSWMRFSDVCLLLVHMSVLAMFICVYLLSVHVCVLFVLVCIFQIGVYLLLANDLCLVSFRPLALFPSPQAGTVHSIILFKT